MIINKEDKSDLLLKLCKELERISPEKKIALAFSAGVDSTILLYVARMLGFDVLAVTFDTKLTDKMISISKASYYAEKYGAKHKRIVIDTMAIPQVANNDKLRCYYCKNAMFSALRLCAAENGYPVCCDGTNADDLLEYRPGLKAKDENGIISPIANAKLSKADIRCIGSELGLDIASAPSSPCLLTRFPYGTHVTSDMLEAVEAGEGMLKSSGFASVRLRIYGDEAKVEIPNPSENIQLPIKELEEVLIPIGVQAVSLDERGLKSGRMDEDSNKDT